MLDAVKQWHVNKYMIGYDPKEFFINCFEYLKLE